MAFNLEGSTDATIVSDNTEKDVTLPGTPIEGDLIVYMATSDQVLDPGITSAGYTDLHSSISASSPGYTSAYKMMTASPDTVIGITQNDGVEPEQPIIILVTWSGVDTGTPLDTLSSLANSGAQMPNPPSVTLTGSDNLVMAVGFLDDDEVFASVTAPSGFSDLVATDGEKLMTPSSTDATLMVATIKGAGTTDPAVFGGDGSDAWVAWTAGFNPLAAGGATPKGPFGMPFSRPFAGPFR